MRNHGSKILIGIFGLGVLLLSFGLRDPLLPWMAPSGAEQANAFATPDKGAPFLKSQGLNDRLFLLERENEELASRVQQLDSLQTALLKRLESVESRPHLRPLQDYAIPDSIGFCGEVVSLADSPARERFEAEFYRLLVNRHWLVRWMRRSREVLPLIETRIAHAGMPDDLKYVAVIESSLDPRAVSSAGAVGYWQFTGSTGRRFGLIHNRSLDQRRDLAEATDAALRYLSELHEEFGSWALSLAGYNAGENRIRGAIEDQGQSDYHRLVLPRETEGYWYKAAAVKLLFEHAADYDFDFPKEAAQVVACDTLLVSLDRSTPILDFLGDSGMDYWEFKDFNPAYRRPEIPRGKHKLAIPKQYAAAISSRYPRARLQLSAVPSTQPRP
ncbi:MAG TPA: lytic transglycosylase domain-containing protein [Candidatus Krumholzibacteria bacterium]|nr:lytic transglycosylase domain-containing protein [Candidatus Krumholzibacteria bacterium]